jgi:hypothetical protein
VIDGDKVFSIVVNGVDAGVVVKSPEVVNSLDVGKSGVVGGMKITGLGAWVLAGA